MTDQLDPPKDGTMVCLLVDYSGDGGAPLEDALTAWTIGYNTLADTGDDEWIMVGWDWCHDCYCQGNGKIIGWAPFAPTIARHKDPAPDAVARLVETAIAEYLLEPPLQTELERMGRKATARGMMVRLGIYEKFKEALAAMEKPQ